MTNTASNARNAAASNWPASSSAGATIVIRASGRSCSSVAA
ncbi:hypothetical protein [Sphingomonas sp. 22R3R2A-7]